MAEEAAAAAAQAAWLVDCRRIKERIERWSQRPPENNDQSGQSAHKLRQPQKGGDAEGHTKREGKGRANRGYQQRELQPPAWSGDASEAIGHGAQHPI